MPESQKQVALFTMWTKEWTPAPSYFRKKFLSCRTMTPTHFINASNKPNTDSTRELYVNYTLHSYKNKSSHQLKHDHRIFTLTMGIGLFQ